MDDLISEFVAETREGLEALDSELVKFEQHPDDPEILGGVFRLIHTIKGTCGFLGLMRLQTVAHAAENVLGAFRDKTLDVTAEAVTSVLETVDLIRGLIERLARDGLEPAGDDKALIERLEAVFDIPAPSSASTEVKGTLPLLQRLGGEATLDAAAETVVAHIFADDMLRSQVAATDSDRVQASVRDALIAATRQTREEGAGASALKSVFADGLDADSFNRIVNFTRRALADLDIDAVTIDVFLSAQRMVEIHPPAATCSLPSTVSAPAAPMAEAEQAGAQTIRVSINSLEHLMTVVSELVLLRNQLIQTLRSQPESPFAGPLHRLSQVTSELQEGVMTTRMQPISGAWAKAPRLVRDLARDLGKKIDLVTLGEETELDRQVLELIKDPLTHMIRNAADHGLETPAERLAAGKSEAGRITLQARHEGGAIVIEISDDGRGLSAARLRAKAVMDGLATQAQADAMSDTDAHQLIFRAGLSTAEHVTAVSGRGVGMDVVRTNIERIGGAIELQSVETRGTQFIIRIPLTLTIVSALIVESCGVRFAMPQSSVVELVSANNASGNAIEYINGAAVMQLRDKLLPLVSLQTLMDLPARDGARQESCIVVARVGSFTFGVLVDRVFDTEEIVVKPVASVLRHLKFYSGATILGDGAVIMILDFKGISSETGAGHTAASTLTDAASEPSKAEAHTSVLLFRTMSGSIKAATLAHVARIEEASAEQLERVDGRTVMQYRGRLMPIVADDGHPAAVPDDAAPRPLLVFTQGERSIGLLVDAIVDIVDTPLTHDIARAPGRGALGSAIIAGRATELIDVAFYWAAATGEAQTGDGHILEKILTAAPAETTVESTVSTRRMLVVDQSPFTRVLLQPLLSRAGYTVTVTPNPAAALALHEKGEDFDLIMADTRPGTTDAREFAATFVHAKRWRETPLVALALHAAEVRTGTGDTDMMKAFTHPAKIDGNATRGAA